MKRVKFFSARNIAYLGVLLALVIVMQFVGGTIKITPTTSLSFVLVPIVLGAILLGPWAGAFLGFVFGLITLLFGVTGADGFTNILFTQSPVLTTLTCLVKGTAAGLVPGAVYRPLSKKNTFAAALVASALAPVMNTGIFILGGLTMSGVISQNFVADGSTVIYFLVIGCAGVNFLIEFAINLVLAPAIHRVVTVAEKSAGKRHMQPQKQEEETETNHTESNT